MSGTEAVQWAAQAALALLLAGMVLVIIRLIRGPNLGDRILALDTLTMLGVGFIAAIAILTGFSLYLDIAIAIGLLGFLSTVALARYLIGTHNNEKAK